MELFAFTLAPRGIQEREIILCGPDWGEVLVTDL